MDETERNDATRRAMLQEALDDVRAAELTTKIKAAHNNDNIELPPLPPFVVAPVADEATIRDYARAAVRYDRERRAKQGAKPAVPVVHLARVVLTVDGYAWSHGGAAACPPPGSNIITLRWTDNGRAWIESERNRELARRLRYYPTANFDEAAILGSADALDGGEL